MFDAANLLSHVRDVEKGEADYIAIMVWENE